MRISSFTLFVIALTGICVAQDTNFSVGPQYLITTGSTQFLRPIATPTLSFSTAPNTVNTTEGVETQPAPAPPVPQSPADLTRIYWGEPTVSQPPAEIPSEIEITSPQTPPALPASIAGDGVTAIVDPRSLRERGQPLGEVAAFWKANRLHPTHVYTNADVARLHGGG